MATMKSNRFAGVVFRNTDAAPPESLEMRAARIDQLGVDRSHFARYALPIASPEMARGEQRLERRFGRSDVTTAEKLEAWRHFLGIAEESR
ncbi:MAG: hypothetical protein ABJA98_17795 [Acidobacteriota bacterium]